MNYTKRTLHFVLAVAAVASTSACSLDAASLLQATAAIKPQQGAQPGAPVGVNGQPANQAPGMQPDCMQPRKVAQVSGPAPTGPAPAGPAPMGPAPNGPAPNGPAPNGPAPNGPVINGPINPGPNQPGPFNPTGPFNPGPNQPAPNQPGMNPAGNPANPCMPGNMQPGPNQPGPNQPGPFNPGPNQPGPNNPGPFNPGPNQPGPFNPTGPFNPGPNQPAPNQPAPNQPAPNQPVAVQPGTNTTMTAAWLSPSGEPLEAVLDGKVPIDNVLNLQVVDDTFVFAGRGVVTVSFKGTGTHWGAGIGKTYIAVYDAARTSDPASGGHRQVGAIGAIPTFSSTTTGSVQIDTSHLAAGSYWLRTTLLVSTGKWEIAEGVLMVH